MKNVLLLSAGRRVELAQSFLIDIAERNLDSRLLATEMRPETSAACQVVHKAIKAPRVTDSSYVDFLLSTCLREGIGLVVPTIDTELLLLSQHRQMFSDEGIHVIISDESLVRICRDKRLTADLFTDISIDTPKIFARDAIRFPCFAKPYDGSCSIGASIVGTPAMLSDAMLADEKMMFMELIDASHQEYTVDAYYDRRGQLRCFVPRQRLETRAGEVSKGVTRRNHVYHYLRDKLTRIQGARGCITLQLFSNQETGRFAALEINPRFGGGYPLTYGAEAKYPGWLIDEYLLDHDLPFKEDWEADLLMLRYDAKVLVHGYN
ncbi:ATP-grasp domain-containing protein [Rhodoferax sp.]|uniref:ATP-grasp domain-containing protein n=1 Tax=Rhodoferax sp. TaxID=50421 RepID=UPI0025EBAA4D|nr:ATP-grasp domain-containing protein [Rhodoferax sp.]MCM2295577.1 ATP-grasp domain-containing protein [Rhodoferax sp.]